MRTARVFGLVLGLALAGPAASFAQSKTGTAFGDFLLIEPSARATGMGNAGVTLLDDLQGVYYNPAAIAEVSQWGVSFSHSNWLAGINYNYAALGIPMGKIGNAYFTLTDLSSGDMEVRTVEHPLGTGELFHVTDIAVGGGYGLRVTDRFSAGIEARFVQETIWHTAASAFVLNMGTVYRVSEEGLHLGASISNFGTQAKFTGSDLDITFDQNPDVFGDNGTLPASQLTDPFPMPVLFRVGVSLPRQVGADGQLLMAVDAFHPSDNTESVSLGTEYSYRKFFSVRAGYQNLFQKDSEVGLTLGAGLKGKLDGGGKAYAVDYAWASQGRLNDTHRITVALHF